MGSPGVVPLLQKMFAAQRTLEQIRKLHHKRISKGKSAVWLALVIAIIACIVAVFGQQLIGGLLYALASLWPLLHGVIWSPLMLEPLLVTAPLAFPAAVFLVSWARSRPSLAG